MAPPLVSTPHAPGGNPTRSQSHRVTSSSTNAPTGPACQTSTPCWSHWPSTSPPTDIASGGGVK